MKAIDYLLLVVLAALVLHAWIVDDTLSACRRRLDELEHEMKWRRVTDTLAGRRPDLTRASDEQRQDPRR
jgi:hypothetical protein